jgi:nitroreductase
MALRPPGLVASDQVQTLRVAATLSPSALAAQQYKFTVLLDRAAPGQAFSPVSLAPSNARVTSTGTLELNFNAPDPGALFRVQTP